MFLYRYYKAFIKVDAHGGGAGAVLLHCAQMNINPRKVSAKDNKSNKLTALNLLGYYKSTVDKRLCVVYNLSPL